LNTPGGQLRNGDNTVSIEVREAGDKPAEVSKLKLDLDMNMPGMVMHAGGAAEHTDTPGHYLVKISPAMAGDWNAKLSIDGPQGRAESSFSVNVKQ
jgi:hypothetical protein